MLIIGSIFTGNDRVNCLRSITLIHFKESKVLLLASTDCLPSHPTTDRGVTLCWMFGETLSCYCKYSFPWPWISSTWPDGVMCSSDHCHFSQLNTGSVYNFPILFMVSTRRIQTARRWLLCYVHAIHSQQMRVDLSEYLHCSDRYLGAICALDVM